MPDPKKIEPVDDDELFQMLAALLLIPQQGAENLKKVMNCMDLSTRRKVYDYAQKCCIRNAEASSAAIDVQLEALKKKQAAAKNEVKRLKGE